MRNITVLIMINNLNNKFTLNNNVAISTILVFGPLVESIKNDLNKILSILKKYPIKSELISINLEDFKDKIMTITNASLEMSNSYGEIVKNYDGLDKPKRDENYHRKEFTADENKKMNEIFRELDDIDEEDPTIH